MSISFKPSAMSSPKTMTNNINTPLNSYAKHDTNSQKNIVSPNGDNVANHSYNNVSNRRVATYNPRGIITKRYPNSHVANRCDDSPDSKLITHIANHCDDSDDDDDTQDTSSRIANQGSSSRVANHSYNNVSNRRVATYNPRGIITKRYPNSHVANRCDDSPDSKLITHIANHCDDSDDDGDDTQDSSSRIANQGSSSRVANHSYNNVSNRRVATYNPRGIITKHYPNSHVANRCDDSPDSKLITHIANHCDDS